MEQNGNTYLCAQNEVPALLKRADFLDLNEMVFQRTLELRLASGGKIQKDPDK